MFLSIESLVDHRIQDHVWLNVLKQILYHNLASGKEHECKRQNKIVIVSSFILFLRNWVHVLIFFAMGRGKKVIEDCQSRNIQSEMKKEIIIFIIYK